MSEAIGSSHSRHQSSHFAPAHRIIIETLTQLSAASDQEFIERYPLLVAVVERDFRDEEMQMEQMDEPHFQAHIEQHARMLGALHHITPRVQEGNAEVGREALALLAEWLPFHSMPADQLLISALRRAWQADC